MKKFLLMLISLLILLDALPVMAAETNEEYEAIVEEICADYDICPEFVESIIFYESSWEPDVKSSAGCIGLMQIHPQSHKSRMEKLDVTDLTDPRQNILVGVDYLAELFDEYKEAAIVIDAYAGTKKSMETYESGYISKYANLILTRSERLEREHGK